MLSLDTVHRLNLREIAVADEEERMSRADRLISYYRGEHLPLVYQFLERLLTEGSIRETWKALAAFRNVTARIVNSVTMVGREPIVVKFGTPAEGEPASEAQVRWDAFHDAVEWPLAVYTYFCYAELHGTVIVHPYWDERAGTMAMRLLTPNLVDVRYQDGNRNPRTPDVYSIMVSQQDGIYEVWDLATRETWREDADGKRLAPPDEIPAEYGDPFIAIRTGYPVDSFWYEGVASELLAAQERINYLLTQRMVSMFYGGKFAIVEGAHAENEESFVLDISKVTFTGVDQEQHGRRLRWDGPDVGSTISALQETLRDELNALCEAYGMPPGAFRFQESERSGIAIQLENAPARDKMRRDRTIQTPIVRKLVEKIAAVWAVHDPGGAPSGDLSIDIPDPRFAQLDDARAQQDRLDLEAGLLRPVEVVLGRHPDWTEQQAADYLAQAARERRTMMAGTSLGLPLNAPLTGTKGTGGQQ